MLGAGPLLNLAWWPWLAPCLRDEVSPALRRYQGLPEALKACHYPATAVIDYQVGTGVQDFFLAQYQIAPLVLQFDRRTAPLALRRAHAQGKPIWPNQPGPLGLFAP